MPDPLLDHRAHVAADDLLPLEREAAQQRPVGPRAAEVAVDHEDAHRQGVEHAVGDSAELVGLGARVAELGFEPRQPLGQRVHRLGKMEGSARHALG